MKQVNAKLLASAISQLDKECNGFTVNETLTVKEIIELYGRHQMEKLFVDHSDNNEES